MYHRVPGMAIPGGGSEAGVGWAAGVTGSTLLPLRLLRAFFLAWISLRALDIMALIWSAVIGAPVPGAALARALASWLGRAADSEPLDLALLMSVRSVEVTHRIC